MREGSPSQEPVVEPTAGTHLVQTTRDRRPSEVFRKMSAGAPPRSHKMKDMAMIAVFLVAITMPLIGLIFRLDAGMKLQENRVLASMPELTLQRAALAAFPGKFETYFNDQFGFRQRLIHWLSIAKVLGLGVSSSRDVILGRKGWIFYGALDLEFYRSLQPLKPQQLEAWQQLLESRRDWLAARGIPYLVVLAPNKSTIYPEFMPLAYNRVNPKTRLDQLMAHLKAHSTLSVIDLREPLLSAKSQEQVYYRTDSHWNNRGAYVGYAKIMEALSTWIPKIMAAPRSEFRDVTVWKPARDLGYMLGLEYYLPEEYIDLQPRKPRQARKLAETGDSGSPGRSVTPSRPNIVFELPGTRLPRAVMFRDSFAEALMPLLAEHFRRITFSWQYTLNKELVEREQPDIVIQEMVERTLMGLPEWFR